MRIVVEPKLKYTGDIATGEHRPVVAGVRVYPGRLNVAGVVKTGNPGTLTGLATRTTDNKKFFVLCQHVLTGNVRTSPSTETIYQMDPSQEETYHPNVNKKIGEGLSRGIPVSATGNNVADVAMIAAVESDAGFLVHGHGSNSGRRVVPGIADPTFDPVDLSLHPSELLMVGAVGGEGTVYVRGINQTRTVTKTFENQHVPDEDTIFTGLVTLDCSQRVVYEGDSGAPCLVKVAEGEYKMAAIEFAAPFETQVVRVGEARSSKIAYAFPASVAENGLGIRFGNKPPTVYAGPTQNPALGAEVRLEGTASDPDGDTITFLWTQENAGQQIELCNANTLTPTFTAPRIRQRLFFRLTVTDSKGESSYDHVQIDVGPTSLNRPPGNPHPPVEDPPTPAPTPTPPTPWADTGNVKGCGPNKKKEQTRTNNGATETQWVADPEPDPWGNWTRTSTTRGCGDSKQTKEIATSKCGRVKHQWVDTPEVVTWGDWSRTGEYKGCGAARKAKESRTDSCGDETEYRWVPAPQIVDPGTWTRTGNTRGCGEDKESEESRTDGCGNSQTRWVATPEAETWGPWSRTSATRGSCSSRQAQETRTSNCDNTQTRWVSDPEAEIWGNWTNTGRFLGRCETREAQQTRRSNCDNTQTQWVVDPEPETWGSWTDTGRTEVIDAYTWFREQQRTSNCGNTETRWVAGN